MKIAGTDLYFEVDNPNIDLDLCTRIIMTYWPSAVFENALTGEEFSKYENIVFDELDELFIYRSREAVADSDSEPDSNNMIHLLSNDNSITIVVDSIPEGTMADIVAEIAEMLAKPRYIS